jgi:hypothetical protein
MVWLQYSHLKRTDARDGVTATRERQRNVCVSIAGLLMKSAVRKWKEREAYL